MKATAEAHADKQIALWFMDEARVGQKGRTTHRWWVRGQRPPGIADKRFESAYIFAGVQPSTGEDFALVLPRVSAAAMSTFLAEFAKTVPEDTHAVCTAWNALTAETGRIRSLTAYPYLEQVSP